MHTLNNARSNFSNNTEIKPGAVIAYNGYFLHHTNNGCDPWVMLIFITTGFTP